MLKLHYLFSPILYMTSTYLNISLTYPQFFQMNETFQPFNLLERVLSHDAQHDKVGKIRHADKFWKSREEHLKSLDSFTTAIFELVVVYTIGDTLQVNKKKFIASSGLKISFSHEHCPTHL